jgi:prepilin-type N-terminal cleavage/methylation domain-containing protein
LTYYKTAERLQQQAIGQIQSETNLAVSALQIKLNRLSELVTSYAQIPRLVQAASAGNWDGAAGAARDAQNNVAFYDTYIDRVVFFDKNGVEQSAYPTLAGGIGANAASSTWYKALKMTDAPVISAVTLRTASPSINVVSVAASIHDITTNAVVGYVVLQIPAEHFLDFGYALSTGIYGITYIVDQNGNLVAHPKYGNAGVINFSSTQPVPELLAGKSGTMITKDPLSNQKNFIVYQKVPQYNWGVVTEEPSVEVFASYNSAVAFIQKLVGIFTLIDFFISYLVFRYLKMKEKRRQVGSLPVKEKIAGFTLIELLIVIAIIAILSIVVVLTVNPAEMLRQSRDSQRVSDFSTLKSAISLYLLDASSPNIASSSSGGYGSCYLSTTINNGTSSANCGDFAGSYAINVSTTPAAYRKNDSTGWLPVNFSQITLGTPLSSLPVDPINNATYYYAYAATSTGGVYYFELDTRMESKKYGQGGSNDVTTNDGGDNPAIYEVGSKPGLNL